ncbi:MAG: polysulfide reductase NrfD [Coriobacteriales bacterium]|nr:polysulfide reductase NrfD [Coriobacteriales bacterium]
MFGIPLFDLMVILYLFLGGASAGALCIMSAWSIVFHRREKQHSERLNSAFKSLMARCYVICALLLVFSILCLIWDLGSPERVLLLFLRPHFTVLTFGAYALLLELLIVFLLAAANLFSLSFIGGRVRKLLEYLCCVVSFAIMLYTGVFLATNAAVPFWNTWALLVLFLFSSLSAGVSIVLLIDYFIKDQTLLLRAARPLQKLHVVVLLLELLSLAAFLTVVFLDPASQKSLALLLSPSMLSVVVVGVVGMGILAPFFLESYNLRVKPFRTIPVSDAICLLGGFCLRYVIIQCGIH